MTIDVLVVLIPLLPLLAAAVIGTGHLSGALDGEADENTTAAIANWAVMFSCLLALTLLVADLLGKSAGAFKLGQWLSSGDLNIQDQFYYWRFQHRPGHAVRHPAVHRYTFFG